MTLVRGSELLSQPFYFVRGMGAKRPAGSAGQALRFPTNISGSDTAAPYAVIKKANPQSDGLPIWGPANAGWTVIRRVRTLQQTGYYAQLWWCRDDGSFVLSNDSPYVGAHPYPSNSANTGTSHVHEIATSIGGDFFNEAGSTSPANGTSVTKDVWYTQAVRVTYNSGDDTKTVRYYPDLANTSDYVEVGLDSSYGASLAGGVNFAFIIGDSPWFAGNQHERFGGDLAWQKTIAKSMSEADILLEAANSGALVTSDALSANWWSKNGFDSVDDLTDDFGSGRSLTRVDTSNLLTLVDPG